MEDEIDDRLFEIKARFLRDVPHPKLIQKGMEQARALAGVQLTAFESAENLPDTDLSAFLTGTVERILKLKLAISQAVTPAELYAGLKGLYETQLALLQKLASYLPVMEDYPDKGLKISDPVDGYPVWRFISTYGLSEDEIKPYICRSLENEKAHGTYDVLTTACLRSRKIITNE
jgi:hypothetical protein